MGPCRTLVAVALGLTLLPPSACMRWATLAPVGRSATRRAPHGPRMCGLVVVIDPSLSPEQLETYTRELTMKLLHRGPDMQDYFGCAGVGLGHTRLSIMDPNGGRQPLVSESSRSAMVHNGEIYNFKELRARVQDEHAAAGRAPYAFSTNSDSEVCLPLFEDHGDGVASALDGMFGIVLASTDGKRVVAARDPCGIKPLYRGWDDDGGRTLFASELKCLVGQCDHVEEFPPGHLWTMGGSDDAGDGGVATGRYERYFQPAWLSRLLMPDAPSVKAMPLPTGSTSNVRALLKAAVRKRMMSDVGYGLLLSGGLDSAIVCSLMSEIVDMKTIKSFTVGMANSPDIMAARAVAESFGCIHHEHIFTADEAFDIVPKVIYHLETYEPELIRSSIPNYFLATLASQHTKVVLTGEGADELFAGYLYFRDAPSRDLLHGETLRIWDALHNVNLQRSDRMSMAHGLEARVPFLDVDMLQEAFGHVDPAVKMHNHEEGKIEKWALRALFEESGIPADVVWRTKAMQCEGVGVDWVSTLQQRCEEMVSDADFQNAAATFPINPPQSKEEYYYRSLFEQHFPNMDKFVHVWPGGCRAGGAPWDNSQYTRAGLKDTAQLTHGLQDGVESKVKSVKAGGRGAGGSRTTGPKMVIGTLTDHDELARALTTGGDSRSVIDAETGRNSYHCPPMPLEGAIVRGSCTGSPPTLRGVTAAAAQMAKLASLKAAAPTEQYAAAFGEEVESVRSRLASALDLPEGSALVLCASGTCAEYVPLAIARELCPTAPIKSVLACDGETGRGGPDACSGKYFNTHTPFYGQDEARQVVGAPLGMGDVELIQLPARTADGEPADSAAALAAARGTTTTSDGAEPPAWVVRQVIGSKTGLSTPTPASMMEGDDASRLFEVIDLCQLRSPLTEVGSHLSSGRTVMLTGSKFFQGSVFSAAVALPAALVARLAANAPSAPPLPAGLSHFLSAHEVPRELSHWRAQLPSHATNEGLLLRWHTALPLVEAVGALDPSRRAALEAAWVARVGGLVESTPRLEGFSSAFGIVSVSCTLPGGRPAGKAELQKVHAWLAADLSAAPGAAACASAATSVFIGQPVAISDGGEQSVVRLALGAELLLDMDAAGEREGVDTTAAEDAAAVTKLGWIVDNYAALEAWSDSGSATTTTTTTVSAAQPHVEKAKPNVVMKLLDVTETVVPRRMPPTLHPNGKTLRNGKAPSLHCNGHTALLWTALRAEVSRRKTAAAEHGMAVAHAKQTLLDADAVCFDVDGTVISEEAINLLADQLGLGAPVRALTLDAQEGRLQFDEALRQRLLLMRPSSADLAQLLECSPAHQMLTPGVLYLISLLRARGTAIYFVSGGFIQLVTPIAQAVGVPRENVYANQIPLNADGSFMEHGLSELLASSPTASKGGKAKVVRQLKEAHSYKKVVMVGDGATDLEARDMDGGADAFIGFGGVFVRDVVRDRACWYVTDFDDLSAHLEVHVMPGAAAASRASAIDRFRA